MQFFTAVGTPDGGPNPQNSTRWRVFCQRKTYNTSEGGLCLSLISMKDIFMNVKR